MPHLPAQSEISSSPLAMIRKYFAVAVILMNRKSDPWKDSSSPTAAPGGGGGTFIAQNGAGSRKKVILRGPDWSIVRERAVSGYSGS